MNNPDLLASAIAAQALLHELRAHELTDAASIATMADLDRAIVAAGGASASPESVMFTNHYECSECGYSWQDEWSACSDDDCPACGQRGISPHHATRDTLSAE